MPNFYLYSKTKKAFLMQKSLGFTDRLDFAGVFLKDEVVSILLTQNAGAEDLNSRDIVPVNADVPSGKPTKLENKLNFRVYTYLIRKQFIARGMDKYAITLGGILNAYKALVPVDTFVESEICITDILDSINESIYAGGVY